MNRHESLYPLSHHHHHALFLALQLKRIGTDKSELTAEEMKSRLETFWIKDGNQHFRDEDEILLPIYAKYKDINQAEIVEMLVEHVTIRSQVQQILTSDENLVFLMNNLGHLLETHVRKEERVIFPMIEKSLPEYELKKLKPYLHVD
ncbi:hemerythrin domain-containing protein [Oceanobacillus halophilus]|uniref:Hemerythrin domain-containing protein n=1 Tax=Oceanobacillus halophilus TaxID=930130 RepID=A0A495AHN1_9BACI|nr:hemerythrin domain-containing protein [Oceanobacillus halophilus]